MTEENAEIEELRKKMHQLYSIKKCLHDPELVAVSQLLDKKLNCLEQTITKKS